MLFLCVHSPIRRVFVAPDGSRDSNVVFDLVGGHLEVPTAELPARGTRAQHVTLGRFEYFTVLGQVGVDATPALFIIYTK